ncbi:MAG: hypothetical protein ACXWVD_09945 [Telluria sp.]
MTTSIPIVLVSALALWLVISASLGHLERTLGALQESRLRYTLGDLGTRLQSGTGLGMAFAVAGNAQDLLDAVAGAGERCDIHTTAVVTALALVGAGHAMSIPAQVALAARFSSLANAKARAGAPQANCIPAVIAGGAAGAACAGLLAAAYGTAQAVYWTGMACVGAAFLFALAFLKLVNGAPDKHGD